MHDNDLTFIILPGGELEPAKGRIPADCPVEAIVFPRVSADLVVQAHYEDARLNGWNHGISMFAAFHGWRFLDRLESHTETVTLMNAVASIDDLKLFTACVLGAEKFTTYVRCLAKGESHNMAMIFATKSFPGVKTDSVFNHGKFSGQNENGCHEKELWLRKEAERSGFSTNGLWYCSGLADYPGDHRAWVGGRGDVERVAREKNLTVNGYVTHKGHEVAPKPDIVIDPKLVNAEVDELMIDYPGSKREDVYEEVYGLRTGAIDPNPLRVVEPTQDWGVTA